MKRLIAAGAFILAVVSELAFAANAAPLNMELGVATLAQVKSDVGARTSLSAVGINKFSGGPMLKGKGDNLGIEGLSEILFIFDKEEKLAGVVMTLPKGGMGDENFERAMKMLSGKYKLVRKEVPFVGNKSAQFKQGDSVIELDAPHLSFQMQLLYLTNKFNAEFNSQSANERAEKQRKQASQL